MKPDIIYSKTPAIYDLAKNDLPIPEEYKNMDVDELSEKIHDNSINIVLIFYYGLDYVLCWPGKERVFRHYNGIWSYFVTFLKEDIGKKAKSENLPVLVRGLFAFPSMNEPLKMIVREGEGIPHAFTGRIAKDFSRCRYCGSYVEKPSGKTIPFCDDTDCRKKYLKFRDLLKKLFEEGKISEFERDCRLNSKCILEDTVYGSRYLLEDLQEEAEERGYSYPWVSTKFIVTPDLDIVFADKTCERCGASFAGNKQARFCSDNCRYQYHNEKKKKLSD